MKDLEQVLKRYYKLILFAFFVLALVARWWYLPAKAISFAYDQARDAFVVQEILGGHLKILGPPVSGIPGLYHGVLYYYIIAPAYLLGHGSPIVVAYWLSFLNSLGVFIVFYLAYLLTKRVLPSLLSALIFAISFEASQYANLLTNASMAVWFVPILYIGLYLWITKFSKWAPIITGLGFGFAVESEIALVYHLAPILLWLVVFRKNILRKELIKFVASFLLAVSSMILVEFKFGFRGVNGLLYLFTGQDAIVQQKEFSDFVVTYFNQLGNTISYTIFPLNIVFGALAGFISIFYSFVHDIGILKKSIFSWQTFLLSYVGAYIVALPFGGWNMRHIMVGATAGVAIFAGIFIWKFLSKNILVLTLVLVAILSTNIIKILKENANGQTIFPLQVDLVLSKELRAVDYTYKKANGKNFSISTLTSPLFVNTLWSYLYNWYGKGKYGYLPFWRGRDQVGQLGNNLQIADPNIK